nr:hypothetical protein [Ferruginibacter sp.]
MSLYSKRGVSAQKEEVHAAVQHLDQGLFPHAFCKIYPDYLGGDDAFVNIMHADGAGTKSILAYLYWKETGDISVWKGIAQDAVVMNLDDLLCVGVYDNIVFNSTIDRNKHLIPGDVLQQIISGTQELFDRLTDFGVHIHYLGGETADMPDVYPPGEFDLAGFIVGVVERDRVIDGSKVAPGDVLFGIPSSGLHTNGFSLARKALDICNGEPVEETRRRVAEKPSVL